MAILCGCFEPVVVQPRGLTLSRYTELVICESAATPGPLATAEGSADGRVPSPETTFRVFWRLHQNTGRCSASVCFTVLTSFVATAQYLRVERTKFCALRAALRAVALRRARRLARRLRAQLLEQVGHLHDLNRAVVSGDPRRVVQTLHVVSATHCRGNELVVLLQDLVVRRRV